MTETKPGYQCGDTDASGLELITHGTRAFPAAIYQKDGDPNPVPWHWHEQLEVELCMAGSAEIAVENLRFKITEGCACFVNSAKLHAVFPAAGYQSETVVFHPLLICGSTDSALWQNYVGPLTLNPELKGLLFAPDTQEGRLMIACIKKAHDECAEAEYGFEFRVREALSQLVLKLCEKTAAALGESAAAHGDTLAFRRLKKMLSYITAHLGEQLTAGAIAQAAGISESEGLRCFKKTVGLSPMQYVKSLRLQKAALLLSASEEKIIDIALQCGFTDMSYFSRAFRKEKGMTPSDYRRRL